MSLLHFYSDMHTKEDVKSFISKCIDEEALEKIYRGEDVSHIKDAKELIFASFDKLDAMFAPKVTSHATTNRAK